ILSLRIPPPTRSTLFPYTTLFRSEKNLDAALVQNKLQKKVKYDVKNGVVTLTGEVNSQSKRAQAEKVASSVPNVQQVVNELQVRSEERRVGKECKSRWGRYIEGKR